MRAASTALLCLAAIAFLADAKYRGDVGKPTRPLDKSAKPLPLEVEEDEDEAGIGEDEPVKRRSPAKPAAKPENEDSNGGPLLICAKDSKPEDVTCQCHENEVNCNDVVFAADASTEEGELLKTLDVRLAPQPKGFTPLYAYFTGNAITSMRKDRMPEGLEESLQKLDVSRNRITIIDAGAFNDFKNLSVILLGHNRLPTIKKAWFHGSIAERLHQLDFTHNNIKKMDTTPFAELSNLKKLILDENSLQITSSTFEGLDNLEELSMDSCDLKDIEKGTFKHLSSLRSLSLRYNNLTEVPQALAELRGLRFLDLSGNPLTEIHSESFKQDAIIQEIYLEDMPLLRRVDDCAFCGIRMLTEVSFTNSTKLEFLHENAFGFKEFSDNSATSLKKLLLSHTNVSNIPLEIVQWSKMTDFDLSNTPLNCTCVAAHFKQQSTNLGDYLSPRCAYPEKLKGKFLFKVGDEELCDSLRSANRRGRSFIILVALIGVVSLVSIAFVYHRRGYRFAIPVQLPSSVLPSSVQAYSNLNNDDHDGVELVNDSHSDEPDFHPRPQAV